jgi:hypothetical protein
MSASRCQYCDELISEEGLEKHQANCGKLFSFWVNVRDGEHEYSHFELVKAKNQRQADTKARRYAKMFLGSKMKACEWSHDNKGKKLEPIAWETVDGAEYRIVEMEGTDPTTPEKVISTLLRA